MLDYEYMLMAIDEVLSHDVAGIICMENYHNCYFPNGFRKIFDQFWVFQKEYEHNKEKLQTEIAQEIEIAKFQARCCYQKEELLRNYIKELEHIEPSIDYKEEVKKYRVSLEQEDVQTLEMELAIYPYLVSLIREREEKVER